MSQYRPCPDCGANIDYGERCDCKGPILIKESPMERHVRLMLENSTYGLMTSKQQPQTITINYEPSNKDDLPALSIITHEELQNRVFNVFIGEEANTIYKQIMNSLGITP